MLKNELTLVVTAHRAEYLPEAILSVACQTTSDFHLICCADVSRGDAALKCFQAHLANINCKHKRIIPIEGNGTAGYTRNSGFAASETEWITYLDGDDYLHQDAIEQVRQILSSDDGSIRVYSSGIIRVHPDGTHEPVAESLAYLPPRWIYEIDPDTVGHATYFNQFQAIRRRDWEMYPYDETTNGEDIDFMLHQLLLGRYVSIPLYLYYYRDTPDSFSKSSFVNGDICTQRYRSGYYRHLFHSSFNSVVAANFRDVPVPQQHYSPVVGR